MTLLAVDAGRSEIEFKSKNGIKVFPSAVAEAGEQKNPALVKDDLEIEVDGRKWWVGRLAQVEGEDHKVSNFGKSKADPILKVQIIASIIYAGLKADTIDLGIIVPIDTFIEEERNDLKLLLKGEHKITYSLVEKTKVKPEKKACIIAINERILIAQEGAAAYWSDTQTEDTQTFDFGAKTVNYAFHNYVEGQSTYVNKKSGTIWLGWETIKSNYGLAHKRDNQLTEEELNKLSSALAKKAVDVAKRDGWSEHCITQVFGGVAQQVFPYIKKEFPRSVMTQDPRNGNVEGLFRILEEVHAYA